MIITNFEEMNYKNKIKVYIDQEYAFTLYANEIKRNKLKPDMELSEEQYHDIIYNIVFRRAKQKVLSLLKLMDRTEQELRQKLALHDFPPPVIDWTLDYIKGYHYIDDERYAEQYILCKKDSKSKYQIQSYLYQKGIQKDIINAIMERECYSEDTALIKAIHKKRKNEESIDPVKKKKLIESLCRKGFRYEEIVKHL